MPRPFLTALVLTDSSRSQLLERTVTSLEAEARPETAVIVAGPLDAARDAVRLVTHTSPDGPLPSRTAGGLPISVIGDGGYEEAFREAAPFSDVVLFLAAGDAVAPGGLDLLAAACLSDPDVGGAWADYAVAGADVFQEPCDRNRLLDGALAEPPAWAAATRAVGHVRNGLFDLLVRLTEHSVVVHLPYPLFDLTPRPGADRGERDEAIERAVRRCQN